MKREERSSPSFAGLASASPKASAAARAASAKTDTRCELALRRELWRRGWRYRLHVRNLPGRPDIVFVRQRVAIFCDGDFWHGRDLVERVAKLERGHNASYWIAKVRRNVERDRHNTLLLEREGWRVLRFWEGDVLRSPVQVADQIEHALIELNPDDERRFD